MEGRKGRLRASRSTPTIHVADVVALGKKQEVGERPRVRRAVKGTRDNVLHRRVPVWLLKGETQEMEASKGRVRKS